MAGRVNLDHNAGGRVRPEVAAAVAELLGRDVANPSSQHAAGRRARRAVEEAREEVAALVGARPAEVVFTSGGTEANNLAVLGGAPPASRIVASAIEHVSVLRAVDAHVARGGAAALVAPASDGRIAPQAVAAALHPGTALVSIGWANGEIGTIQPIAEIVAAVREAGGSGVLVHSDAVQAAGPVGVDLAASGADLLSVSGHKIGAFPGVGALVVRSGVALRALLVGGPQERERRAGTENVPGIVGFGVAARLARAERAARVESARVLRERLWSGIAATANPVARLGRADGLATTLAVAFPGLRGDALVLALDLAGVAVSAGSACAAGAAEPSHVLRALGVDAELAAGAIRLSIAPEVGPAEVDRAVDAIATAVGRARASARDASFAGRAAPHAA